jgi:MoxR-like ATPase
MVDNKGGIHSKMELLRKNMNKVLVGKQNVINLVLVSLLADGHILLEDSPGMGKTILAKTLAKSMSGDFKRIQFTPDVLPSDVTGIHFFNPKDQQFELRIGPVYTNILLADEINRATPRTQSSLLESMEERQVTIDGETISLKQPFLVIATQNPIESHGTFPLPEAQLDRFFMKISLGYPTFEEEQLIMQRFRTNQPLEEIEAVLQMEELLAMRREVREVRLSEEIERYILSVVHATRTHQGIEVGVSPRGTLSLMRGAQAKALLEGRNYVIPDDVKSIVPQIIGHRILLTLESELHISKGDLLEKIIDGIEVPLEEVLI